MEADIASSGTAESYLSVTSVTGTRQAHQITACSLYKPLKKAYHDYCSEESSIPDTTIEDWCKQRGKKIPQFQLWILVLVMELTIITLVRSFREGDFNLYREALSELAPYFFANNNVSYARWIPIHFLDMISLEQ